jgi:pyruvate/2-oxoglutarate dehydrogenase complex dihydrolipoamide acyltransferase (E2) component
MHNGTDFRAPSGTNVFAAGAGTVTSSTRDEGLGNYVVIVHPDDTRTTYGHLSARKVKAGDKVKAGQVIGLAGATGHANGAHLHFETRDARGRLLDPIKWLRDRHVQPWGSPVKPKPAPKPAPTPKPDARALRFGSIGKRVEELQRVINAFYPGRRPRLVVDGRYFAATEAGVKYVQQRLGRPQTGVADSHVLDYLGVK